MSELPEGVSIEDQAAAAGRPRVGDTRMGSDDIDELRSHVTGFCNRQGPNTPSLSRARTKFEEALFWLRSHRNGHLG